MSRVVLIVGVLVAAAAIYYERTSPDAYEAVYAEHFQDPMPASAQLLQYKVASSGFEPCHAFLFEDPHGTLFEQIVGEWGCTLGNQKKTVVGLDPPWWYPKADELEALDEESKRGRVDFQSDRFWSVWYDAENGRLFAEYGTL